MSSVSKMLQREVVNLRKQYPDAVAHADNTEVIAPKELANRIHHMFRGTVLEPIFIQKPGIRTLVIPRATGGVEYRAVPM